LRTGVSTLLLVLLVLLSGCAGMQPRAADAPASSEFAGLQPLIEQEMRQARVPGLSLSIIRNGELVYRGSFGVKRAGSPEPITRSTLFEAASLSKPLFAYFAVLQSERGLLELDRPLHQYMPHPGLRLDSRHRQLTARHVLAHVSGLPNWRSDTGGTLRFLFEPGTRFGYSGEAYEYLKEVLKHVLRTDDAGLQALIDAEVSARMGARFMKYTWDPSIPSLKAHGHRDGRPTDNVQHDGGFGASYTLHTTSTDYARFLMLMMRPDADRRDAVERLLELQHALPQEPGQLPRSLGFPVKRTAGGLRYFHSGNNGDFRAYCHFDRDRGDGIVLFANSDRLFSSGLAERILAWLEQN
jgi:CubicO group peptidase (beta-lactamase class C family)